MAAYILQRLTLVIPVLLGTSILVFILVNLLPGDVTLAITGPDSALSQEQQELLRRELGLDQPPHVRYLVWLKDTVRLDLGQSLLTREPVADKLMRTLPRTLNLAIPAFVVAVIFGLLFGTVAALNQGGPIDYAVRVTSMLALAIPHFWLGALVSLALVLWAGWSIPVRYVSVLDDPWLNVQKMFVPVLILGWSQSALLARMVRSSILEVMREDYVRTAQAKGLHSREVTLRHILRNSLLPVVTLAGLLLGNLMSGSVVMEKLFNIPGMGSLLVDAVSARDYPVVQAAILLIAGLVVLLNLMTDLLYAVLDPRIRYGE